MLLIFVFFLVSVISLNAILTSEVRLMSLVKPVLYVLFLLLLPIILIDYYIRGEFTKCKPNSKK